MSDPLAERLKKLSDQHTKDQEADADARSFQEKVNTFISEHSRAEYDHLLAVVQKRVDEVNPQIGDLPKFQITQNGSTIQQGNAAAYLHFDKPILNRPENALLLSIGSNASAFYLGYEPPAPVRYRLQAAASDSLDRIVWVGDLGELISEQLADFVLEHLTEYYLSHRRQ